MEDTPLFDYGNDWKADSVKDLPHLNHVNPLVINEKALGVYIGRYLRPINSPEELKGT